MYSNELTIRIPGSGSSWSERSLDLLRFFIRGSRSESGIYKINKVVYRWTGSHLNADTGLWLFSAGSTETALFYTPDLSLGHGGTGTSCGEALLEELGIPRARILGAIELVQAGHEPCEVTFELEGSSWRCRVVDLPNTEVVK